MQLVNVVTTGDDSSIEWLVTVADDADLETFLETLAEEYAIPVATLYIQKQMRLFEGDLPLQAGAVFERVI